MFMQFCGGGVGHLYMRHIEPWLDETGWGASWPSLGDRDPYPDQCSSQQGGDRTDVDQEDEASDNSDSDGDSEMGDVADDIDEDTEQLGDSEDGGEVDEEDDEAGGLLSDGESEKDEEENGEEGDYL